jgi:hypothetical protein
LALSQVKNHPLARRVIFEYKSGLNEEETILPMRNELYSKKYNDLPKGIKKALTGRLDNFLFPPGEGKVFNDLQLQTKFKKKQTPYKLYFKAACYDAFADKYPDAFLNIERAFNHGFTNFARFETLLKRIDTLKFNENFPNQQMTEKDYDAFKWFSLNEDYKNLKLKYSNRGLSK